MPKYFKATKVTALKTGAVIYARVSTKGQAENNLSLTSQEKLCREYCERQGLKVLRVFTEAASAKTAERPQFKAMLAYCVEERQSVQVMVVYSVSRFSRSTADHFRVRTLLDRLSIALHSISEPLGSSAHERFMEGISSLTAQFENEQKAEQTVVRMKASIAQGNWVNKAPIGYRSAGRQTLGRLALDPVAAPFVKRAFEMFANEGFSKAEIQRKLTAQGFRTKQGRPVAAQTLNRMLSNPIYSGWVRVQGWGISVRGRFEPIISDELFERTRQLTGVDGIEPQKRSTVHEAFPLRLFVRCGHCDTGLTGSASTGKKGGKYPYYHCRTRSCEGVSLRQEKVHDWFVQLLTNLQPKAAMKPLFFDVFSEVLAGKNAARQTELGNLRREQSYIQERKQKAIDAMLDGRLDQSTYEDQMRRLGTQLDEVGTVILQAEGSSEDDAEIAPQFAWWFLEHVSGIWQTADVQRKARIQRAIFPQGLALTNEGFGTPQPVSVFNLLAGNHKHKDDLASPAGFEPALSP